MKYFYCFARISILFSSMTKTKLFGVAAMGFCYLFLMTVYMAGCESSMTPRETVIGYKDALNSHSIDSLMSFYGDEVVFSIPDLGNYLTGKEAMRGVAAYDSVLSTRMQITDIRVHDDTVFCSIQETNLWMDAAGISSAFYPHSIFVVKDEKIIYLHADLADSSAQAFRSVLDSFVPWAQQKHPEEFALMAPDGEFQFNADNGATMVSLMREWRDSKKN